MITFCPLPQHNVSFSVLFTVLAAATSGSGLFFAGTDSAPHPTAMKESSCGCAGVYNAHAAVELYAEAFESVGALDKLDDFLSKYGSDHYGLSRNRCKITLVKKGWTVPKKYKFGEDGETITPLRAGETVNWSILWWKNLSILGRR